MATYGYYTLQPCDRPRELTTKEGAVRMRHLGQSFALLDVYEDEETGELYAYVSDRRAS